VEIPVGELVLQGTLTVPEPSRGLVLFAHGTGSGRFSPRNRYVAGVLVQHGIATLLMDLLTAEEEAVDSRTGQLRFDVTLLAERVLAASRWLRTRAETAPLRVGYFGASTGAAAALLAAARRPDLVAAIVSRGGRPDLAAEALEAVRAPTLLIVGERDPVVLRLNREALERFRAPSRLEIVPGASHLFEEPGALEAVARLAREWFARYLEAAGASRE
jgi:dienelactone hydrolase